MPHDQQAALKAVPVKTILVVEDDADIAAFLSLAIAEETPYHPLIVPDGSEALRVMQHIKPNLVMIDYRLPHMNGIELYDLLQETPGHEALPTINLSASLEKHEQELRERHLLGLKKPFELDELLQTIEQVFAARGVS